MSAGNMRERLTIQTSDQPVVNVTSLTRTSTTATATTSPAHGWLTGDYVTIAGAAPAGYNGKFKIVVTGPTTFTYPVTSGLTTPATGTIAATYFSDAHGGRVTEWRTLADRIPAELLPIRSSERLQLAAIQSDTAYRFRVYARADLSSKQQALWTPSWPQRSALQTLAITGVLPDGNGVEYQLLEMSVAP